MSRLNYASVVCLILVASTSTPADDKATQRETQALKGPWRVVSFMTAGKAMPKEEIDRLEPTMTFMEGGKATFSGKGDADDEIAEYSYSIDASKTPKTIDLTAKNGKKQFGIYKLANGKLTICATTNRGANAANRPAEFVVKDKDTILSEMERPKKK